MYLSLAYSDGRCIGYVKIFLSLLLIYMTQSKDSLTSGMCLYLHVPCFTVAGVSHLDGHRAPIVSITPISTASASTPASQGDAGQRECGVIKETSGGLSFQLATLDR